MTILKPSVNAVSRIIGDRALILDPSVDEIRQLNEVASAIWSLILKSEYTRDDILHSILTQFEVSQEIAETDLDLFIAQLDALSLIERPPS